MEELPHSFALYSEGPYHLVEVACKLGDARGLGVDDKVVAISIGSTRGLEIPMDAVVVHHPLVVGQTVACVMSPSNGMYLEHLTMNADPSAPHHCC